MPEQASSYRGNHHRERTYPPPFPDGWYRIAASGEIKPGEIRHVQCLGEQIAVFRSQESGRIAALDAFCPHMGANLAYGEVKGDRLECPFHGWQLDGDGRICQPRLSEDQPFVQRRWEAIDYYGMILIYHSSQGKPAPYHLPQQQAIDEGQLVYRGKYDAGEVEMHIIEFVENSVDFSHFYHIHGTMRLPWTRVRLPWIRIRHDPSWFLDDTLEHIAYFRNEATLEIRGRVYESTGALALITFLGPGSVVKFEFDIPRIGKIMMFQTHTPVEAMKQQVNFRWFASRGVPGILASYVVGNWISQWKEDLDIWKRKIYRKRPLDAEGEGSLLGDMRKWYRQFYPDDDLLGGNIRGS
ncbi:MAG: Rieske 2Fe-2S domain-containing protein [Candidatus Dadabacteria bacterium]|nr:Rieske 2Fe-2S domain-containing protein [Candidatus Dadabacteria bacterium]MYB27146.1 Rieske 2Fe-2S domain-containing protein [Candidatus Dadabacteria bacterium]